MNKEKIRIIKIRHVYSVNYIFQDYMNKYKRKKYLIVWYKIFKLCVKNNHITINKHASEMQLMI